MIVQIRTLTGSEAFARQPVSKKLIEGFHPENTQVL